MSKRVSLIFLKDRFTYSSLKVETVTWLTDLTVTPNDVYASRPMVNRQQPGIEWDRNAPERRSGSFYDIELCYLLLFNTRVSNVQGAAKK